MAVFLKMRTGLAILAVAAVVTACTATFRNHGYIPSQEDLDQIVVGVDTRGTVEDVIGTPSSMGVQQSGGWYYISTRIRHYAYQAPRVIDRQMVAVSFDEDDVVTNIETFSLEDGRVIALSRRVTELPVKGPGFWRQILGNLGNFDAGQIIGDG